MINLVEKEWQEHQKIVQESEILKGQIAKIGELLCECLKKGGKILICGNGGRVQLMPSILQLNLVGVIKKNARL